jgi:hypothetical protein
MSKSEFKRLNIQNGRPMYSDKGRFVEMHRNQRQYAYRKAIEKYPAIAHPYLWGKGTPVEHTVNEYKEHPKFRGYYFKCLKEIRAKRFK